MLHSCAPPAEDAGCDGSGVSASGPSAADGGEEIRDSKIARNKREGGDESGVIPKGGNLWVSGIGGEDGGLRALVESLIRLELEGVFRTVMCFL